MRGIFRAGEKGEEGRGSTGLQLRRELPEVRHVLDHHVGHCPVERQACLLASVVTRVPGPLSGGRRLLTHQRPQHRFLGESWVRREAGRDGSAHPQPPGDRGPGSARCLQDLHHSAPPQRRAPASHCADPGLIPHDASRAPRPAPLPVSGAPSFSLFLFLLGIFPVHVLEVSRNPEDPAWGSNLGPATCELCDPAAPCLGFPLREPGKGRPAPSASLRGM